jgi:hypothetical protein
MRFWHWLLILLLCGGVYVYTQKPELLANLLRNASAYFSPPPAPTPKVTEEIMPTVDTNAGPHDLTVPGQSATTDRSQFDLTEPASPALSSPSTNTAAPPPSTNL